MGSCWLKKNEDMKGKPLGFVKTLRQEMDGVPFNVQCTKDDRFVTKLMSTHGLIGKVADHKT